MASASASTTTTTINNNDECSYHRTGNCKHHGEEIKLVKCGTQTHDCNNKSHHVCCNKYQEELYKLNFGSWPPPAEPDGRVINPYETDTRVCELCQPVKLTNGTINNTNTTPNTNNNNNNNTRTQPTTNGSTNSTNPVVMINLTNQSDEEVSAITNTSPAGTGTNGSAASTSSSSSSYTPAVILHQAAPGGRKPKNNIIREQFDITPELNTANNEMYKRITCRHCDYSKLVKTVNITQEMQHLLLKCKGETVTNQLKRKIEASTQKSRRNKKLKAATSSASVLSESVVGIEPLQHMRDAAMESARQQMTVTKRAGVKVGIAGQLAKDAPPKKTQASLKQVGVTSMTEEEADKHIMCEVIECLANKESLTRLLNFYWRAKMISFFPAIKQFLPNCVTTIFNKYVVKIDKLVREELVDYMSRLNGDINVGFDGVTIHRKSKQLFTIARGQFSMFDTFHDLGSATHQTEAEVKDAVQVCTEAKERFKANIASVAVDNAAASVGKQVCEKLPEKPTLSTDCAHTFDLLSKDMANLPVVKEVLEKSKKIFDFCKKDNVSCMRSEAIQAGKLEEINQVVNFAETRMNNVHEHVESALKQYTFCTSTLKTLPQWQEHYRRRTKDQKAAIDEFFRDIATHAFWMVMEKLTELTVIFRRVHKVVCRCDAPVSAMPLLVQALRNEINAVIGNASFDQVLGAGSAQQIAECIRPRFNMDGTKPVGVRGKVGLLDEYHWHAFLCDPYQHVWRRKLVIGGCLQTHVTKMIENAIPLDEDGGTTARDDMKKQFLEFHLLQGKWINLHDKAIEAAVSEEELQARNKKIKLTDVVKWIEDNNGLDGRFTWYEAFADTDPFYHKVARRLMSIGTVGSINTERAAKSLKHDILSIKRNRLSDEQAVILYRVGENLRHLKNVRESISERLSNSVLMSGFD